MSNKPDATQEDAFDVVLTHEVTDDDLWMGLEGDELLDTSLEPSLNSDPNSDLNSDDPRMVDPEHFETSNANLREELEELEELEERGYRNDRQMGSDSDSVEQEVDRAQGMLERSFSSPRSWLRYGPILVFMMALAFYLLPTLLSEPSDEAIWANSTNDPYVQKKPDSDYLQLENNTEPNLLGREPAGRLPDTALAESEAELLNAIAPTPVQTTEAKPYADAEQLKSDADTTFIHLLPQPHSQPHDRRPTASVNVEQVAALQAQQMELMSVSQAHYQEVSLAFEHITAQLLALHKDKDLLVQQLNNVNVALASSAKPLSESSEQAQSIYVLDTTQHQVIPKPVLPKQQEGAMELTDPVHSAQGQVRRNGEKQMEHKRLSLNAETRFDKIVLHDVNGEYLSFVSQNCSRFSLKVGDSIPQFGTIIGLIGSRVYSHSRRFISRGHFRQCSRSVLIDDSKSGSSGQHVLNARTHQPNTPTTPQQTPEPSAYKEPSADKEPSAYGEPSANKEPSADKEPSAYGEPSAYKEPSADREPSANKEPSADKKPSADKQQATTKAPVLAIPKSALRQAVQVIK